MQTVATNEVPDDYVMQIQSALLVTGREWIDFISYCGGLPMFVKRVLPDAEIQDAIVAAATSFEERVAEIEQQYRYTLANMKLIPTERREAMEIII